MDCNVIMEKICAAVDSAEERITRVVTTVSGCLVCIHNAKILIVNVKIIGMKNHVDGFKGTTSATFITTIARQHVDVITILKLQERRIKSTMLLLIKLAIQDSGSQEATEQAIDMIAEDGLQIAEDSIVMFTNMQAGAPRMVAGLLKVQIGAQDSQILQNSGKAVHAKSVARPNG